jgi:hypothetical protein
MKSKWGTEMARGLSILFLLLIAAVAVREIPERYGLANGRSNDGMIFDWQSQAPVRTPRDLIKTVNNETARPTLAVFFAERKNPSCTSAIPAKTGQDILRRISSLRT